MSASSKKAIRKVVDDYVKLFPEEFEAFRNGMVALRATVHDKFAKLQGTEYTRALYEMPETLSTMLITNLEEEDMVWLKSGGKNGKEGGLWFARTFKDFRIPDVV